MLEDDLDHLGEVLAQELSDGVRAQRLGDCREAADVAEQHGRRPALAALADGPVLLGDVGGDVGGEVPLEVGADGGLAADLVGVMRVLDPDGREPAERDQELQVLVGEGIGRGHVVDVEQAEHPVGRGHEGGAHGAPDALEQDRLAAEAGVRRGVLRHDRDPLLHDLLGDRPRHLDRLRVAQPAS